MRLFKANRHRRWQQDLSAYIDGRLEPRKQRALEVHLAECASCQQEMEALRGVVALLHRVREVPVPRSFALSQAPTRTMWWATLHAAPLRYATAAAALLLLAVAVGDLVTGQPTIFAPEATPATERRGVQAPEEPSDETIITAAAPTSGETAIPAVTPTPQPRPTAAADETEEAMREPSLLTTAPVPGAEETAVPAVTPTPQPKIVAAPEKTEEIMRETALPEPALEEPRTTDAFFLWAEVALGVILAVLAALVTIQWWLGRRKRVWH